MISNLDWTAMTFNLKLRLAFFMTTLACAQSTFPQTAPPSAEMQPMPMVSEIEVKPIQTARVVIEYATSFDQLGTSDTRISIDQAVVCKINRNDKICDVKVEPGKHQIELNTDLDLGTFSENYDLEAGKRYKLEVVLNQKNFWVDALFLNIPVSAMFNEKGKTASLKFKLIDISDEPQK